MKVTYLYHSGFLVEWENCCFLFDYIRGDLPQQAMQKPFFVYPRQDKTRLIQSLGALRRSPDTHRGKRLAYARKETAFFRQRAAVGHHAEGVHL